MVNQHKNGEIGFIITILILVGIMICRIVEDFAPNYIFKTFSHASTDFLYIIYFLLIIIEIIVLIIGIFIFLKKGSRNFFLLVPLLLMCISFSIPNMNWSLIIINIGFNCELWNFSLGINFVGVGLLIWFLKITEIKHTQTITETEEINKSTN